MPLHETGPQIGSAQRQVLEAPPQLLARRRIVLQVLPAAGVLPAGDFAARPGDILAVFSSKVRNPDSAAVHRERSEKWNW